MLTVSSPDPRYYKDPHGLKPRWRLWLTHPLWAAWLSSPDWFVHWRNRRRDRKYPRTGINATVIHSERKGRE